MKFCEKAASTEFPDGWIFPASLNSESGYLKIKDQLFA